MTSLFQPAKGSLLQPARRHSARSSRALLAALALPAAAMLLGGCTQARSREKQPLELPSVSVTQPSLQEVSDGFSTLGSVQAASEVTVVSESSGRIIEMPAKIGMRVGAGAPLVHIDKDLREAAFIAAEAAYTKAAKDVERLASLHADKLTSDADVEAARLGEASARAQYLVAKKEMENTTICSAISGTIADTYVSVGEQLGPGTRVALIVDTSRLKVRVLLPERAAVRHHAGDTVLITTELFPGRTFTGRIDAVSVRGDDSHSFPADVTLLGDASAQLRAGMSVKLHFNGHEGRKVILIPRAAVVGSIRSPEVFLAVDGLAVQRLIVTGEEHGTDIEVLDGLTEKDFVVTGGQTLLADRQAVKIVEAGGGK